MTLLVAGLPWAWRHRGRLRPRGRPGPRTILAGLGGLALLAFGALLVVPRLGAVTSLLYRASLWQDTLSAWATDPLLGIGPGFMPYARQAAAADFSRMLDLTPWRGEAGAMFAGCSERFRREW